MWAVKYRPRLLSDVLGQAGTIKILKARLREGKAADTSYILSGGFGNGKTTIARILACGILCENISLEDPEPCYACPNCLDFMSGSSPAYDEFDAASNGTIAKVRANIVDVLAYSVLGSSKKRVFVIDECHQLSKDAQDAILKPLEEKLMVCIFCTTELSKVRGAIRSRCEEHYIRKVSREEICESVKKILDSEGVSYQEDAVLTVIDYCDGHIRDVLNRLETIAQVGNVTVENVRENLHLGVVPLYYEALLHLEDPPKVVETVEKILESVAPEDALQGFAEAAMNSFRLTCGIQTSFVSVDRALAKAVFDRYGSKILKLASFFSKSRSNGRMGVICDLLTVLQQYQDTVQAVQTVQQLVQIQQQSVQQQTSAVLPTSQTPALPSLPTTQTTTPASQSSSTPIPPTQDPRYFRTEYDAHVINGPFPRGHASPGVKPLVDRNQSIDWVMGPVTSDEWRKLFEGYYGRVDRN